MWNRNLAQASLESLPNFNEMIFVAYWDSHFCLLTADFNTVHYSFTYFGCATTFFFGPLLTCNRKTWGFSKSSGSYKAEHWQHHFNLLIVKEALPEDSDGKEGNTGNTEEWLSQTRVTNLRKQNQDTCICHLIILKSRSRIEYNNKIWSFMKKWGKTPLVTLN